MSNQALKSLLALLTGEPGKDKAFREIIKKAYIAYDTFANYNCRLFNVKHGSVDSETKHSVSINLTSFQGKLYRLTIEEDCYKLRSLDKNSDKKFKIQDNALLRRIAWALQNMELELLSSTQDQQHSNGS